MEKRVHMFSGGTYNFDLKGKTLWAGHDNSNKRLSGSYVNNCQVKYLKYFTNSICSDAEIKKLADCSADKCKELKEPPSCTETKAKVEGDSPLDHKFTAADGRSGYSFTLTGWVMCINGGRSWANIWHLSPTNKNTPRNPSLYLNMGGRYLHSCMTNKRYNNHNMTFNSGWKMTYGQWFHIT